MIQQQHRPPWTGGVNSTTNPMASSMAASASACLGKLGEEAEKAYALLASAGHESHAPLAANLEELQASLLSMCGAVRILSVRLRTLGDPEREEPPPQGSYNLGRLVACKAALSDLVQALGTRTSAALDPDHVARAHWTVRSTLANLQIALPLDRCSRVLGTLSTTPPAPPTRRTSAITFDALFEIRTPDGSRPGHRILDALCSTDHSTARALELLDTRCPGTADWVFTAHGGVKSWMEGSPPLLHLSGPSGCGKSVIAATIVSQLARTAASQASSLCYFFVDPRVSCTPCDVLSSLLAQILAQSPKAYKDAEAFFAIPEEESSSRKTDALRFHQNPLGDDVVRWVNYRDPQVLAAALRAATQNFSRNHVVIDGMDHLPSADLHELFQLLTTLDWARTQILILSRPVDLAEVTASTRIAQEWRYQCCPISASPDDLRIFTRKTAETLRLQLSCGETLPEPLRPDFLEATADSLAQSRNFQYVQYQLWYLRARGPGDFRLPASLPLPQGDSWDATYAAIIDAIIELESKYRLKDAAPSESDKSRARSVLENALFWLLLSVHTNPGYFTGLAFSKRGFFEALSLVLAPHAGSVKELEPAIDVEARFSFYLEPLAVEKKTAVPLGLAGLKTTKMSTPLTQYSYRHSTVVEYLMKPKQENVLDLNLKKASTSLALAALRYMSFPEFKQTVGEVKLQQKQAYERHIHHPFYHIAAGWLPEILKTADSTHLQTHLFDLFHPTHRRNYITFFLEYCNHHFPWAYELTNLSHTSSALVELVEELATGRLGAFHIAVSLGLPDVCRGVKAGLSESDAMALANAETTYGSPLALALLGPRAFAVSGVQSWQDFFVPLRPGQTSVSSIDVRGTVVYLLELGVNGKCKFPSRISEDVSPAGAIALMRCALLKDADLFILLMENTRKPSINLDAAFIKALDEIFFADCGNLGTPVVLHNTLARYQLRALSMENMAFLGRICEYLMDRHIGLALDPTGRQEDPDEEDSDELLTAAWNCAFKYGLACARFPQATGDPGAACRPINCSDEQFSKLRERNLREFQPFQMLRLMQDPRWDVNQPLENQGSETQDENAGQTALHVTAENEGEVERTLAKILIQSGADVSAKDARGRTPLHVAEDGGMLKLLLDSGADSQAQDSDGRTVWHVSAANNDSRTLRELVEWHRPEKEMLAKALRCVTKQGRTPLAEAVAFFYERSRWANVQSPELVQPGAVEVLLPLCKGDPLTLKSDVPLIHLATEWGRETLLTALDEAGAVERGVLTPENETAFHFLNPSVSQPFLETLSRIYGTESLSTLSLAGKSAVEAFMDKLAVMLPPSNSTAANPQATVQQVDPIVFDTLLVPSSVKSKDRQGRTFWERFCYKIIAVYCHRFRETQSVAADAIFRFSEALNRTDAIKFYEEQTSTTAFLPLVRAVWTTSKYIPLWFSVPCVAVLLKTASLGAAGADESVILTLKWAISSGKSRLVELLLERGANVHAPARGHSVLEEFHKYDMAMFEVVLQHADKSKLNTLNHHGRAPIHNLVSENESHDRRGSGIANRSAKLAALASAGANINLLTDDRMSPVILASMKSNQESAVALLELGADTSVKLPDGLDVSLAAASRGCVRILRKLMTMKSPIKDWVRRFSITVSLAKEAWKKRIYQGCHALHIAALNCQVGALRFYLEEKLIPVQEPCYDHKMTALHFAAVGGASDAIRYLVGQGADINAPDVSGLTPLHVGVQARHPDSVRTLLSLGANKALRDREGRTPLLLAIQWNVHLCFNLLREQDPQDKPASDAEQPTDAQISPSAGAFPPILSTPKARREMAEALENSVMMGDPAAVSFVLKEGCHVDEPMPSCGECSALGLAIWTSKYAVARLLLDWGAKRFTARCSRHGFLAISALFSAAIPPPPPPQTPQTHHCLVLVLDAALRDGANWLNAHFTPLHIAAQQSNLVAVTVCLKHIATNAAAYRKWLASPTDPAEPTAAAAGAGQALPEPVVDPVVREIVNRHVSIMFADDEMHMEPTTALHIAMINESVQIARVLIELGGADVDAVDWALSTPLHRAVNGGFDAGVRLLVDKGASANLRNREGYTPLMRAARAGYIDMCRLLITKGGADATVRDLDSMSLLSCCAEKSSSPALFDYLAGPDIGLDPYARDKTTYSPLHDAILNPHMTAYVFSGRWDLARVARGSDLLKGLFALVVDGGTGRSVLPRLRRRWPRAEWPRYVDASPPRYISPLCLAAIKDYLWEVDWLIYRGGAALELESAAEGTALMAACAHGRIGAVKILVRAGARVAYVRDDGHGPRSAAGAGAGAVENALEHARAYPHIVRWLLVGRYTEQGKILDRPHSNAAAAANAGPPAESASTPAPADEDGSRGICRVVQVPYVLTGTNREYGRTRKESGLEYLIRAQEIRASLRGKVVVPFGGPG